MKMSVKYTFVIAIGMLFGLFVILPINEVVSYFQYHLHDGLSLGGFIVRQLWNVLSFQAPLKLMFYLLTGGVVGGLFVALIAWNRRRNRLLFQMEEELAVSLAALIARGEDDHTEFKSSFRYDYKQEKMNRFLESVIIKAISGFLNTQGGSLLIGVADDGTILGLDPDYNTLSRKDNDGYTQLLMSAIADRLGTPVCRLVRILFYRQGDKEVCRLIILPSPIPVYTREEKQVCFYIRTASGTRAMEIDEAVTFIKAKWG
jgi:hypothetical protein